MVQVRRTLEVFRGARREWTPAWVQTGCILPGNRIEYTWWRIAPVRPGDAGVKIYSNDYSDAAALVRHSTSSAPHVYGCHSCARPPSATGDAWLDRLRANLWNLSSNPRTYAYLCRASPNGAPQDIRIYGCGPRFLRDVKCLQVGRYPSIPRRIRRRGSRCTLPGREPATLRRRGCRCGSRL